MRYSDGKGGTEGGIEDMRRGREKKRGGKGGGKKVQE